jgi:hypothetical protein
MSKSYMHVMDVHAFSFCILGTFKIEKVELHTRKKKKLELHRPQSLTN